MEKTANKNKFNIIIMLIWFIITIAAVFHHELWRDETQAWCIVRDCSFSEIVNMIRIEGHLILWYLIIMPFAKLGLSPLCMQIISIISVASGLFLLLFKSNLSNFQKILTVFSAGFLYYFPVIARNYSLIPLILFSISLFWNKKNEHPYIFTLLIILLSNTHPYMLGLSAILAGFFIIENYKKNFLSCIILCFNFLFIVFWFLPAMGGNTASETKYKQIIPLKELIVLISQIYLFDIVNTIKPLIKIAVPFSVTCFIPFLISSFTGFFKENRKVFFIVFGGISFILCAFSVIFFNGILYQKLFLVILILIFGITLLNDYKNKLISYSVNTLLIISCIVSFIVIKNEFLYDFSGSKKIADYINQNYRNENVIIALGNPYLYSSISAYLPNKKLYSPIAKDYISYYSYKPQIKSVPFPENANIFILDEKINPKDFGLKVIFENNKKILSSRTEREIFRICIEENSKK